MLDIDPRVSPPGCPVDTMTASALAGLAKEEITDLAEVVETDSFRIASHLRKDVFNLSHRKMVPLLVSLSSWNPAQKSWRER
jgi:hypothetical protein